MGTPRKPLPWRLVNNPHSFLKNQKFETTFAEYEMPAWSGGRVSWNRAETDYR